MLVRLQTIEAGGGANQVAMTAVLVDDQLVVRDGLAALLDASGFDVLGQASRTDEGVELAVALKPDVVLLNVAMPGRGGLDAIGEIRRALPQCAIVAYSSFIGADRFHRALEAGAGATVSLGTPGDVVSAISDAVERARGGDSSGPS